VDENRLDVAEMPLDAEIAIETGIAERANGKLNCVAYVAGRKKARSDERFRFIQRMVERVKQDLSRAAHEQVDFTG
jgi:hypothetical protein